MQRRDFIALLGGAAAARPLAASAQQPGMPVIGCLTVERPGTLSKVGFVERRNVAIEYHWANGDYGQFPALAADFVRRRVSVIFARTSPAALAAKAATTSIPIVFALGGDPVKLGLVASMNRPGGNVTGASSMDNALTAKRLEMLSELVSRAKTIAFLVNPTNPNADSDTQDVQTAARTIGRQILVVPASNDRGLETAFRTIVNEKIGALLVVSDASLAGLHDQIVALAARHAVPAIYDQNFYVEAGGLISYRGVFEELMHDAGVYVGRILKGEKPTDLPVLQPTKFDLILNLKTAKALGLTVPLTLQVSVPKFIE